MVRLVKKTALPLWILVLLITGFSGTTEGKDPKLLNLPDAVPENSENPGSLMASYRITKENPKMGYGVKRIVLDAGHGGKDFGTRGKLVREKDIALDITLKVGKMISEHFPELEIIYTRDQDEFIPLHKRAEIANKSNADLFVSIHCNYSPKKSGTNGTETFVMGLHRASDNLDVAKRENASILMEEDYKAQYDNFDPNSNEGHIALSMYQNAFLDQSIAFANLVEKEFSGHARRESRGVKQAGFLVLRNTFMPSVLIETGFLSDNQEESYLSSDRGKDQIAWSIFKAFAKYKTKADDLASRYHSENKIVAVPASYTEKEKQPVPVATKIQQTPEVKSSKAEPAKVEEPVPASSAKKLEYYIQVAASSNKLKLGGGKWDQVSNVLIRFEKNYYKYQIGEMKTYQDAKQMKENLKKIGFSDAFVVAYYDGNPINIQEAIRLQH